MSDWPTEPPIPLYGHGGACDRIRQELGTLGALGGLITDPAVKERILASATRIERVVEDLEGRP